MSLYTHTQSVTVMAITLSVTMRMVPVFAFLSVWVGPSVNSVRFPMREKLTTSAIVS